MSIDTQLTTLFCLIDDFCTDVSEHIEQYIRNNGKIKRMRQSQINASEVFTLVLWFHLTESRNFKTFYFYWAKPFLSTYFPNLFHRMTESQLDTFSSKISELPEVQTMAHAGEDMKPFIARIHLMLKDAAKQKPLLPHLAKLGFKSK